jgi:hypothetical protein
MIKRVMIKILNVQSKIQNIILSSKDRYVLENNLVFMLYYKRLNREKKIENLRT